MSLPITLLLIVDNKLDRKELCDPRIKLSEYREFKGLDSDLAFLHNDDPIEPLSESDFILLDIIQNFREIHMQSRYFKDSISVNNTGNTTDEVTRNDEDAMSSYDEMSQKQSILKRKRGRPYKVINNSKLLIIQTFMKIPFLILMNV